jgi:hypothetical protein
MPPGTSPKAWMLKMGIDRLRSFGSQADSQGTDFKNPFFRFVVEKINGSNQHSVPHCVIRTTHEYDLLVGSTYHVIRQSILGGPGTGISGR